nr:hypothetical protein [Chloroflexota bacterium]
VRPGALSHRRWQLCANISQRVLTTSSSPFVRPLQGDRAAPTALHQPHANALVPEGAFTVSALLEQNALSGIGILTRNAFRPTYV